jgi:histidinol-phosphate aminotransferase
VVGRNARQIKLALEQKGILLRYYSTPELLDCIRISVGLPEHTDRLIAELKKL